MAFFNVFQSQFYFGFFCERIYFVCLYVCVNILCMYVKNLQSFYFLQQSLPNSEVTILAMKSLKKDVDIYLSDEILESKLREFQVYEIE